MTIAVNMLWVLFFVLVGGVFAATEMALVSLREGQIRRMERSTGRARKVAALARDSTVFLSAVQIGVTFAGFFSSAFGASTIAPEITPILIHWGVPETLASSIALVVLTLVVSYLSLVLGELVPKRIAIQRPESVSTITGPPLAKFATMMRPVIWLLGASSDALLRLLRVDPDDDGEAMTDEEVRDLVSTHEGFAPAERELLADVMASADRLVQEVMRHRGAMVALPVDLTLAQAARAVRDEPHSRYPVYGEGIDDILGFVHVRDLLQGRDDLGDDAPLAAHVREVLLLPGTSMLRPAMQQMRIHGHHLAVVVDEYGGTDGLVTLEDLLEELVGEIWDEYDKPHVPDMRLHETREFDGATNLEDFAERTGVLLPDGPYETIAGWLLAQLGRLATVGDTVEVPPDRTADPDDDPGADGASPVRYELEVVGVERARITTVRLHKTTAPDGTTELAADPTAIPASSPPTSLPTDPAADSATSLPTDAPVDAPAPAASGQDDVDGMHPTDPKE